VVQVLELPLKTIFRGKPTATTPENTIFRGGDPNRTTPRNAFLGAVKSPSLEIFTVGGIVAVGLTAPENLFYPSLKMFSIVVIVVWALLRYSQMTMSRSFTSIGLLYMITYYHRGHK
jgi:hypothetical protein